MGRERVSDKRSSARTGAQRTNTGGKTMTETELRTEIERLSLDLHEARESIARLRKERDALREALTGMLVMYGGSHDCEGRRKDDYEMEHITVARAALAQGEG